MNVYALTAGVLIIALILSVIKQIKSEYAVIASVLIAIGVVVFSLEKLSPIYEYLTSLDIVSENKEYIACAVKALGVSLLCSLASEICHDVGENTLAFGIELFGKCEILALCFPLIIKILDITKEIMG